MTTKPVPVAAVVADDTVKKEAVEIAKASGEAVIVEDKPNG